MTPFATIWAMLAANPLFWLLLTIVVYAGSRHLSATTGLAVLNPVLVSVAVLATILLVSDTSYGTYFRGAKFVDLWLGPATIALAVPLCGQLTVLRSRLVPVIVALLAGSLTAIGSAFLLSWAFGLAPQTLISMLPKSVTTPIAMGVSEQIGGSASLTTVFVLITGMIGAVIGLPTLTAIGVADNAARGFALGTVAHGIGTVRAFEESETAGAFSSLAMGLNGVFTALALPLLIWLLT
ncbi:LrgB family protein [Salinisphaera sp. USBA-960]|nr:LrgB family protein [Salifodinibacter halophilus]NNC26160.1 LrgB family protein [Salifodinibacter halophilus]